MPQLIRPGETTVVTKTKQGECSVKISLDLNINLNADGVVSVQGVSGKAKQVEEEDKVDWTIGDFAPKKKVNFGKTVQE
jgi:hypothetical protein